MTRPCEYGSGLNVIVPVNVLPDTVPARPLPETWFESSIEKSIDPAELKNAPIFADVNFQNILNNGDSLIEDNGNGDAGDFFPEDTVEQRMPDTNKKEPKKEEKKSFVPSPIANDKKTLPKPKPKTPGNEY